ncbi:hypothetical protein R3P38DRAFT_1718522 [Favolaschia claudopus]|uniref:Uncharacterized protein n=1 Tax=Favolaschia claudopus TaxID=2862362 RepID=A0AAW0AAG7_9AGAR
MHQNSSLESDITRASPPFPSASSSSLVLLTRGRSLGETIDLGTHQNLSDISYESKLTTTLIQARAEIVRDLIAKHHFPLHRLEITDRLDQQSHLGPGGQALRSVAIVPKIKLLIVNGVTNPPYIVIIERRYSAALQAQRSSIMLDYFILSRLYPPCGILRMDFEALLYLEVSQSLNQSIGITHSHMKVQTHFSATSKVVYSTSSSWGNLCGKIPSSSLNSADHTFMSQHINGNLIQLPTTHL